MGPQAQLWLKVSHKAATHGCHWVAELCSGAAGGGLSPGNWVSTERAETGDTKRHTGDQVHLFISLS